MQCLCTPYLAVGVCKHPREDFTKSFQLYATVVEKMVKSLNNINRLHNIISSFPTNEVTSTEPLAHVAACRCVCSLETRVSPQNSLALEEALQAQQTLLPLRPVGAGTVVEDLCHVLCLAQVVRDAAVP